MCVPCSHYHSKSRACSLRQGTFVVTLRYRHVEQTAESEETPWCSAASQTTIYPLLHAVDSRAKQKLDLYPLGGPVIGLLPTSDSPVGAGDELWQAQQTRLHVVYAQHYPVAKITRPIVPQDLHQPLSTLCANNAPNGLCWLRHRSVAFNTSPVNLQDRCSRSDWLSGLRSCNNSLWRA